MGVIRHNEKTFIWNNVKISTVYGKAVKSENISSHIHTHSQYELFIFESGKGSITGPEKKVNFSRNTAIIIPPHTEHDFYSEKNTAVSVLSITFNFKKNNLDKREKTDNLFNYFNLLMPKQNHIISLRDKYFGEFFRRFDSMNEPDTLISQFFISNMMKELFLNILRLINKKRSIQKGTSIYSYKSAAITNDVILAKCIDDYLNTPGCTLTSLAANLNMCPRNTQRVLRNLYGMNYSQKVAEIRLRKAHHLIKNTDYALSEIAKIAQYNQYASFRKAFIKRYGMSPSQYREKLHSTK